MSHTERPAIAVQRHEREARHTSDVWLPLVYDQLHAVAVRRMKSERSDHSLQPTALLHEAYLRVMRSDPGTDWESPEHLISAAVVAMRRILIEHARRRASLKRGGDRRRVQIDMRQILQRRHVPPETLLEIDEALTKLQQEDPVVAELVRLRLYGGLSVSSAAAVMKISRSTGYEYWSYAISWFMIELNEIPARNNDLVQASHLRGQ